MELVRKKKQDMDFELAQVNPKQSIENWKIWRKKINIMTIFTTIVPLT